MRPGEADGEVDSRWGRAATVAVARLEPPPNVPIGCIVWPSHRNPRRPFGVSPSPNGTFGPLFYSTLTLALLVGGYSVISKLAPGITERREVRSLAEQLGSAEPRSREKAAELGLGFERMPSMNDDPAFVAALAGVVERARVAEPAITGKSAS